MAKSYVVVGPLATPYRQDGSRAYLYEGSAFGPGLRAGEAERFLDLGLIAEVDAPKGEKSDAVEPEQGDSPAEAEAAPSADEVAVKPAARRRSTSK